MPPPPLWEISNCFSVHICAGIGPLLSGADKKQALTGMLISRFWSLLGVHHIQNMTCYNLKFNTKPDMGSTSHPFSIYYLIFSSSQPIWFSDQGLFTIWTAFCSYQVKKKQNKTTKQKKQTNKNDVNAQKWHFAQASEIAAFGPVKIVE